jgi:hypothetical protein
VIRAYVAEAELTGLAAEIEEELEPLMLQAADAGAGVLLARVQQKLSRTGASVPGGPPAKITGELLGSFAVRKARKLKRSVEARVQVEDADKKKQGEIARKAAALEYGGTDKKGRVHPPYPYMRTAEEEARGDVDAEIARVLDAGVQP